jgi:hypothetical protein
MQFIIKASHPKSRPHLYKPPNKLPYPSIGRLAEVSNFDDDHYYPSHTSQASHITSGEQHWTQGERYHEHYAQEERQGAHAEWRAIREAEHSELDEFERAGSGRNIERLPRPALVANIELPQEPTSGSRRVYTAGSTSTNHLDPILDSTPSSTMSASRVRGTWGVRETTTEILPLPILDRSGGHDRGMFTLLPSLELPEPTPDCEVAHCSQSRTKTSRTVRQRQVSSSFPGMVGQRVEKASLVTQSDSGDSMTGEISQFSEGILVSPLSPLALNDAEGGVRPSLELGKDTNTYLSGPPSPGAASEDRRILLDQVGGQEVVTVTTTLVITSTFIVPCHSVPTLVAM